MTMRYVLAIVGLCAPLPALAQEVDGSPVAHAIGDFDSFLVRGAADNTHGHD